jgi:cytoplasmic iron level regulating protein YaaA (DUF328/UPF0246 family)
VVCRGVLVLLPASESKRPVTSGATFDPTALSFPSLAPTRREVLEALVSVSATADGPARLDVPPGRADAVRANLLIAGSPAAPAGALYAGGVYDALEFAELDPAARRRASRWVVIISALWGAVRCGDRIAPYRLNMCGRLPGLGHLPDVWRAPLAGVLPQAAGRGLIVDCRAAEYATAWRPTGELADRTVVVKARRADGSGRGAAGHDAKRTHGLLVRRIVADAIDPRRPEELAAAVAAHFAVELRPATGVGRPWQLDVTVPPR